MGAFKTEEDREREKALHHKCLAFQIYALSGTESKRSSPFNACSMAWKSRPFLMILIGVLLILVGVQG